jgi:hypothetical protein
LRNRFLWSIPSSTIAILIPAPRIPPPLKLVAAMTAGLLLSASV